MQNKIFLIGEIGINHNGDLNIAKALIDNAKLANFNSVKFQKRTLDKVYSKEALDAPRISPWGKTNRQQKEGLELNYEEYLEIDNYCKQKKIDWFASAWDLESIEFLEKFNVKYHKIASAMIVDKKFLNAVAKTKKHTFISTGMSTESDISNAVDIFRKNNCSFELMHCVSTYPMKPEDANLVTINALRDKYKCDVGYSGHENGVAISLAATFFNITSLERHITLDRTMYGSDQAASLEFTGMKTLSGSIKKMAIAHGTKKLGHVTDEEKLIAQKLRSHISN
ncbi:N-acetylneuraminate synthase family protein [Candidatus Pelagibacter sp.]|nr:N-acetylneuraminate synthase family protein [Candidatus Pelagibacter sp.]